MPPAGEIPAPAIYHCRSVEEARALRKVSIGSQRGPRIGVQKGPQESILLFGSGRHPSVPAHAVAEPTRGTAVKNGRFISGRPQGLFLRAVSTAG